MGITSMLAPTCSPSTGGIRGWVAGDSVSKALGWGVSSVREQETQIPSDTGIPSNTAAICFVQCIFTHSERRDRKMYLVVVFRGMK